MNPGEWVAARMGKVLLGWWFMDGYGRISYISAGAKFLSNEGTCFVSTFYWAENRGS